MFKFVPEIKKILLLQRNEYQNETSKYFRKVFGREIFTRFLINFINSDINKINKRFYDDMNNEFDEIQKFLPKSAENILDIGCGIGAIDIFLNKYYNNLSKFHLVDKNYISKKIVYGFSRSETEGYNNLYTTKNFLLANKVDEKNICIYDIDKDKLSEINYDLVISLVSWCYHYPLETYLSYLRQSTHNKTIFIIDIAEEFISIDYIKNYFNKIEVIKKYSKKHRQTRLACEKII